MSNIDLKKNMEIPKALTNLDQALTTLDPKVRDILSAGLAQPTTG